MYSFGFLVLWKEKMHRRRSARWLRREARDGAWLMASPPPPPLPPSSSVAAVVVGSFVSKVVDIFYRILFLDDTKNMKASTVPGNPILSVFSTGLSVWSLLAFSNIFACPGAHAENDDNDGKVSRRKGCGALCNLATNTDNKRNSQQ